MSHRILIVEDNEDTREILRAMLVHHGLEVLESGSGEDALARFAQFDADLIILDVRLPGIDGCETLERLRQAGCDRPVYLFSEQYDLFQDKIRSCRPDAFFPKSKGPRELVLAVLERLGMSPPAP